jgi:methylamine methyltransferase corrinoid activation protein
MSISNLFLKKLKKVNIEKRVTRDIDDVGQFGIDIVKDIGITLEAPVVDCIMCHKCEEECPEDALVIVEREDGNRFIDIDSQHCLGTSADGV